MEGILPTAKKVIDRNVFMRLLRWWKLRSVETTGSKFPKTRVGRILPKGKFFQLDPMDEVDSGGRRFGW
jgi:hypothetical protein